uniref:G protein-coupled receptor n=1 Tax=Bursaphelenchus xylophilus TaxID=6326 RepID=A0A1I7RJY8_BURXY
MSGNVTRTVHFYFEIGVFLASWLLEFLVLYVVQTRTPKYLRAYGKMIAWNTIVDLFFSLVSVVLMGTLDVRSGLLYIVIDNPYHPTNKTLGAFSASLWTFSLYLTVLAIPLQFLYRYGILARSKPYSKGQILIMICGFVVYALAHSALCPVTMQNRSKEYDELLELNPIFQKNLPNAYLVGDARTSHANRLHILHCQIILLVSYGVTIVAGYKTFKAIRSNRLQLNEEREEMQREISRIMVLQAIYPVVAMAIPLFFLAAVPFFHSEDEINFYWLGMVGIGLVNLIPILNSLSVIFMIPHQRLPRLRSRLLAPALSGSGSEPGARAGAGNFGVGSGSRAQSRSQASQRQHVQPNQPCNPDSDLLLMENRALSPAAYLRCVAIGIGGLGYWTQNFCPAGMVFEFLSQQCKYPAAPTNEIQSNSVRKELELMNIAILNGSCIHGEQCIGGTVCDPIQGRCLCPYGTVANLETLSCTATPALGSVQMPKQSAPGESCANGEKCSGGSICVTSLWKCLCPQELENVNGQCVQPTYAARVPLHGQCSVSAQCPDGSSCVNNQCLCISPYVELQGACVEAQKPAQKTAGPGELCNHGEVCQRGSVCDSKIPVCVCPPGTDLENGECVQVRTTLAALNTFYTKPTKTWVDPQKSYGKYGPQPPQPYPQAPQPPTVLNTRPQSQVIFPSQPAPPLYTAVPPQPTPQTAPPTQARTVPSFPTQPLTAPARSVTSRPQNPFRIMSTQKVEVGKPCTLNADCTADAYCNGNTTPPTCQCLSTHVEINSKCEKIMYPGQTGCNADKQCQAAFPGTSCQNGQCVCPQGLVAKEQTCVVVYKTPGQSCDGASKSQECILGAECIDSQCECIPPLLNWKHRCVHRDDIHLYPNETMACVETLDCPTGFSCLQGSCQCGLGSVLQNGRCLMDPLRSMQFEPTTSEYGLDLMNNTDSENAGEGLGPADSLLLSKQAAESLEKIFNVLIKMKLDSIDTENREKDNSTITEPNEFLNSTLNDDLTSLPDSSLLWFQDGPKEIHEMSLQSSQIEFSRRKRSVGASAKIVGEPCLEGDICLNGTSCINGTCSCPPEYEMKSGKCRKISRIVDLNQRCDVSVDHCKNGADCRRGICVCVDGALEQAQKCRQRVGGSCAHGEECTGGSECDKKSSKCACPTGYFEEKRKCVRKLSSVGESCSDGELCTGSVCKNGKCECASEDYEVMDGKCVRIRMVQDNTTLLHSPPKKERSTTTTIKPKTKSKPKSTKQNKNKGKKMSSLPVPPPQLATAKPGQMCADGEACMGGSICKDGICSCSDEEIIVDDKCVSSDGEALQAIERITRSAPGQLCTDETICTGNSICVANVCVCPEGSTLFQKECLKRGQGSDISSMKSQSSLFNINALDALDSAVKTVVPGAMCKLSLECPYRTECIRGVCRCQRGETIVNGMCRKAIHEVPPGGRCDAQKGLDCVGESHCFYGICVCLYGLVTTAHECASSEVLKIADPGESCELSQQCGGGSECVRGICECPKDKVLDAEKSQCLSKPSKGFFSYPDGKTDGEKPDNLIYGNPDEIPHGRFNQILSAKQMSINVVDLETLKSLIGGQFSKLGGNGEKCDDNYCTSGARCVRGLCQCPDGYQDENGYCQPSDQNANSQAGGGANAVNGEEYGGGQQELQQGQGLDQQPYTQEALYQQYQQQQQLQNMLYQQQLYQQAAPSALYVPGNGYGSFMPAMPGSFCSPNTYCYGGSSCLNGLCMCRPGYRSINGVCQVHRVALGDPCAVNEQCVTNGICQDGVCSCGRGIHFRHRHRCPDRVTARPGEECTNNQVCAFNSVCGTTSGVCECPVGLETTVSRGAGECVPTMRPRGTICLASGQCHKNSYCDNGFCMCKSGFVVGPDGICLPQPKAVVDDPNVFMSPEHHHPPEINFHPKSVEAFHSRKKLVTPTPPEMKAEKRVHTVVTSAPGEFCATTKLCSGNAICVHGYCKCPDGTKVSGRRCVAPVARNIRRSPTQRPPYSPPRNEIMFAPSKKTININELSQLVQPFSRCDLKKQCVDGAICATIPSIGKVCICDPSRIFFMGICIKKREDIKVARIGDRCNIQHICENGSECVRGVCRCPLERREKSGFCLREAKPGESCQQDEFCAPNSVCRTEVGACVCPVGSSATDAGCTRNAKVPYHKLKEVKNALPGQLCDTNLKCTNGSRCTGFGFCECPQNFALVHSMCIEADKVRRPGEQCNPDTTICTANSWCKDGWCRCLNKQHPHDGKCGFTYLDVNVGAPNTMHHPSLVGNYLSHLPKHENGDEYSPNLNPPPIVFQTKSNGPFAAPKYVLPMHMSSEIPDGLHNVTIIEKPTNESIFEPIMDFSQDNEGVSVNSINSIDFNPHNPVLIPHFIPTTMRPRPLKPINSNTFPFNTKHTQIPLPLPGNDHIRVFKLEHKCITSIDCPIGSYCMYSRCFCDNLPLRNTTRVTAGTCRTSQDCIEPLTCVGGMCICVPAATASTKTTASTKRPKAMTDVSVQPKRPTTGRSYKRKTTTTTTTTPSTIEEEIEEEFEEYEDFSEEEVTTETSKRRALKTTTPNVPSVYVKCNNSRPCALDAECRRGRCVCIDPMKRLAFREGRPVCEFVREKFPTTTPDPIEEIVTPPPRRGEIGWKCEFSAQCNRRLTCVQGICLCVSAVDNPCGHDVKGRVGGTTPVVPTVHSRLLESKLVKRPKREKTTEIPPGGSCAAGEKCVGGSVCHRGWCVCPDPLMVIYGGECRKPTYQQVSAYGRPSSPAAPPPTQATQPPTRPPQQQETVAQQVYGTLSGNRVNSAPLNSMKSANGGNLLQPRTIAPGKQCGPLDQCAGGSVCVSGYCLCPSGMAPDANGICKPRGNVAQKPVLAEVQHQSPASFAYDNTRPAFTLKPIPFAFNPSIAKSPQQLDECQEIGLHCKGGTICVDKTCQCPMDQTMLNDECVPLPPRSSLDECRHFHSMRSGKLTAASTALLNSPFCQKYAYSRWPRRAPKRFNSTFDLISELVYARPTESCASGEICTGGAICQQRTKCVCPDNKPIIRNFICIEHPNPTAVPKWACEGDVKCPENSTCDGGDCKCQDGYVKQGDKCVMLPREKNGEKVGLPPARPTQSPPKVIKPTNPPASNVVLTPAEVLKIQQARLQQYAIEQQAQPPHSNVVRLQPRAVPRISGPRLQRPTPRPEETFSIANGAKDIKELGADNAKANCPPGVSPLYDDESGRLRICNGMEPHCPPRSYCYVTGMASADYNCSHKYAKPGRLCNQGQLCTGGSICDSSSKVCWCAKRHTIVNGTCTNNTMSSVLGENCDDKKSCQSGAVCVDGVCKCPEGYIEEEGFCTKLVQRKRFKSYRYYEPTLGAARCQPELCRPPDCFCSLTGRTPPINVPKDQLPQIVVLTFDDPVNDKSMRDYVEIFQFINFTSPSGCSVKGTFFVSHEWTNYNQVEQLADHGHELASNSITHRLLTFANYSDWLIEMDGQRKMLARYANVDESQIIGMRAPQLGLGGDLQYKMAQQSGFIYDNSISVDSGINWEPFWPQTLDYSLPFACESDHCPRSSIPGLWMIPMNVYYGHTLKSPMLQGILAGDEDDAEILRLLDMNFQRYYTRNKAPFVINLSNDFLQRDGGVGMRALKSFLLQLHQLPDVHFMTLRELVDWMRAPLTHQQLLTKRQCGLYSYTPPIVPRTCLSPNKCMYNTPYLGQSEHIFYTCNRCPLTYPWI